MAEDTAWAHGRLLRKYAVYFASLVGAVLLSSELIDHGLAFQEDRATLEALHREKALAAAERIEHYIGSITQQLLWAQSPPQSADSPAERRLEFLRVLRLVPAITEIALWDGTGRERLRVSRLGLDALEPGTDHSRDPSFQRALRGETYYGPVTFRKETEPYMTLAIPGGGANPGVIAVEVNLKFVWDVVSTIRFGRVGYAYVVDATGQLVSHPDIGLVLQRTELAQLPQVGAALAADQSNTHTGHDLHDVPVWAASARVATTGWHVLVEQPRAEALEPLYASLWRTATLLAIGLLLAVGASVLLARRIVTPIRALQRGAERIGNGALHHRIHIRTGDELQMLADQFNLMAARLQASYATLEQKVDERTHALAAANRAKSRFLAAASHDLRQPMHALGLFVAQLRDMIRYPAARRIVDQASASAEAMTQLIDALLDISRLDAGALTPRPEHFCLRALLQRMETQFGAVTLAKGLRLRVAAGHFVAYSDPVLVERILTNLMSNAVRYTAQGGIVLGCRPRGDTLRIEVWDSGIGIPREQQTEIFQEFFQITRSGHDTGRGLGLGLAIVDRLARLLGHHLDLRSQPGRGSCFAIELPRGNAQQLPAPRHQELAHGAALNGLLVAIIDDEALIRSGMEGTLRSWGCEVISAASGDEALIRLAAWPRNPDLIIADYHLGRGQTGIQVIDQLTQHYGHPIPATLVSGDTGSQAVLEARRGGYTLLHKPVAPAKLRAVLSHLVSQSRVHTLPSRVG